MKKIPQLKLTFVHRNCAVVNLANFFVIKFDNENRTQSQKILRCSFLHLQANLRARVGRKIKK